MRDDLERRAQSLIEQLKELVADKHNLAPEQFEAEKSRLEREAAAALRARDEYIRAQGPSFWHGRYSSDGSRLPRPRASVPATRSWWERCGAPASSSSSVRWAT